MASSATLRAARKVLDWIHRTPYLQRNVNELAEIIERESGIAMTLEELENYVDGAPDAGPAAKLANLLDLLLRNRGVY